MNKWIVSIFKFLWPVAFGVAFSVAHAQNVHGVFRVVKGEVQVKSAQSGQTSRARLGQQVFPKDVIVTGADSRAKIVMVDNNEINVAPDSQVEIQHYEFNPDQGKKNVLLNVIYGKVRSKVEQHYDGRTSRFQVKTPSAVAGVRGTDFVASYDRSSGESSIVTFQGKVEFGLPGPGGSITQSVAVTPGKTATAPSGSAPSAPVDVPKAQLAKMDNESRAESTTTSTPSGSKNGPAPAGSPSSGSGSGSTSGSSTPSSSGSQPPPPPPGSGASSGVPSSGSTVSSATAPETSSDSSSSTSRGPASVSAGAAPPPPPMLQSGDLVGGSTNNAVAPSSAGAVVNIPPGPPPPPTLPPLPPSLNCTTCSQVLQQPKSTSLTIQVK